MPEFGGPTTTYNLPYGISVSSELSQRPGWTYELLFDLTFFDIFFFPGDHTFDVHLDIKPPGNPGPPICEIALKDAFGDPLGFVDLTGNGTGFTGETIDIAISVADLQFTAPFFTVQWNQVPAPGAFALLAGASLITLRRRRG